MKRKIIIAPNAFKGSLDAFKVAEAISEGLGKSKFSREHILMPIADGGDGTLDVLVHAFDGEKIYTDVTDALGRPIKAPFGLIDEGRTAIIEMASASGIQHLTQSELNPMEATSYGTGQLILAALAYRVNEIILTLGGSATVDGGLGILQALGLSASDHQGNVVKRGGQGLNKIVKLNDDDLKDRVGDTKFTLLCDVDNPLLGPDGAAHVFGPQKGATPELIDILENGLSNFNKQTLQFLGKEAAKLPHGGAAGGSAAFLCIYLHAIIEDGAEYLFTKMNLANYLDQSDILITAEGRIDSQTRHGKGPYAVAKKAKAAGLLVIALSGQVSNDFQVSDFPAFDAVIPITNGPVGLDEAMKSTRRNIVRTSEQIGNLLAAQLS